MFIYKLSGCGFESRWCHLSMSYLGRKVWHILPDDYKTIQKLDIFENKFKKWKPETFPCKSCKFYIDRIGFFKKS